MEDRRERFFPGERVTARLIDGIRHGVVESHDDNPNNLVLVAYDDAQDYSFRCMTHAARLTRVSPLIQLAEIGE